MGKKLFSIVVTLCLLLSLSVTAWAAGDGNPTELDISTDSITIGDGEIDEDGYIVSGEGASNTLTVSGGTEESPLKITFSNAAMQKFIIGSNSYLELTLQGNNNSVTQPATDSGKDTAIVLPADSTLVLSGSGDLTVTGGGHGYNPIAAGKNVKGGTVIQNTTGTVSLITQAWGNGASPNLTKYVLNSGTLLSKSVKADGSDYNNYKVSMTADYFEKNGGTITAKAAAAYFTDVANITITQGLYDGVLEPKGDSGIAASARYKLLIGDNRAYWKSNPVTVSYGASNYTYNTDENGNIDFFAPATADTISVKVNETTYDLSKTVYGNQSEVKYVGPVCSCDTDPGPFILDEETTSAADGVHIYTATSSKTLSLKGVYTPKDTCLAPYHTNYVTPAWEITAITKNGAPVDVADYVEYAELNSATGVLTLKYADADYTVSVKGTVGTTNKVTTETLTVSAKIYKATTDHVLDIADGNITVTAGVDENEGKVVYTQGSTSFAVAPDKKVTIAGTAAANSGNIIKVDNCSPSIILHNVAAPLAAGAVSPILISGDSHAKIYISGTNELLAKNFTVNGGDKCRNICGIELSSNNAEKPAKVTIDCIEETDCEDKNCPHELNVYADLGAGIGSQRDSKDTFFEVNIEGGHIIAHTYNYGVGIGSGWGSTAQFTVNMRDGFVEAKGGDYATLIGQGRGYDPENVFVNISGGVVEATTTFAEGGHPSIRANVIEVSGTDTAVDITGGFAATEATFISGGASVSVAKKAVPEGATGGSTGSVSGTVIVEASASYEASVEKENNTVTVPTGKMEFIVVGNDGTMTLPAGSVVETPDGATITAPAGETLTLNADGTGSAPIGSSVTVTDKDGNVTTITPSEDEKVVVNPDGTVEVPAGSNVNGAKIPAEAGPITLPANKVDEVKVGNGGVVQLPAGTVIETEEGAAILPDGGNVAADGSIEGAKVTENTNGSVTITDKDGNKTTITPADGKEVTVNSDGTVTLPKDSPVTITDKDGNETTITPAGGSATVSPDGTVELPTGSTVTTDEGTTTLPAGTGTVTLPTDKLDEVKEDETGAVTLPAGTVVETEEGKTTLPDGGSVNTEGTVATDGTTITEKADGTVEITKGEETTTITPPAEGGSITVKPDGTVEVPAGSTVEKPDGSSDTITNGGTVDKDGTVTETPTPKPPYSGGYYPSYTPTVTPSVDSSSLNNAAQAVGSAINNGNAELEPATGYTKEDIAKLQKEGKLNLTIEKKSGYASVADKNLIDAAIAKAGGAVTGTVVMYFDITPVLKTDDGKVVADVTDTEKPISITIDLSADLQKAAKDGKHIAVVRCHDGKITFLDTKLNAAKTQVTFSSADFSTYAVVAMEKQTSAQTFDAGIVVYAGMAVLAATGSAVVIGKKRK